MLEARFAGIAAAVSQRLGSPFFAATAKWPGTPTFDSGGSIVAPGIEEAHACTVQFDNATQAMRQIVGYVQTDVRILVLRDSIDREIDTKAQIIVSSGRYAGTWEILSYPSLDPAGIGYECLGRRVA